MTKTEERLADALAARADAVDASSVRPLADAELAGADRGPRRSRWLAPAAAAASIAIVAAAVAVVAGTASLRTVSGSPRPPIAGLIEGVSAVSANDVWAVGWQITHPRYRQVPLIVHWDGARWQRVAAPPGLGGARLVAVAGSSPDDVWVVGTLSRNTPLILHWNGDSWRQVRFAGDTTLGLLYGITAISPTDAWATGLGGPAGHALLLHWNGLRWTRFSVPKVARVPGTYLFRAVAISADDIWAVGTTPRSDFALHWDGRTWSDTRLPSLRLRWLQDVAAGPGNTVWAAANDYTGQSLPPVLLRWNGTVWQRVQEPHLTANVPLYLAVAGPNSVWAVGGEEVVSTSRTPPGALIFHWNGSSWARFGPKLTGGLYAVTVISARSAWAAGFRGRGSAFTPIVLHWNGLSWKQVYGSTTTRGMPQGVTQSGSGSASVSASGHATGHG